MGYAVAKLVEVPMKKITYEDWESRSVDSVATNIASLARLFPEAIVNGGVDFDALRELLGGVVDESDEKFGLSWHGKRQARRQALRPTTGTLRPSRGESVDWDSTRNLMIEGDNLEALKLLQRSYAAKVKLIYIDPPYNTGKDFVYKDNYKDGVKNYLKATGQLDGNGDKLCSNTDASGRFHTNWLNMMYPRLKVARTLLRQDGIIAVSIDQGELANLQKVMDELWGEDNCLAILTRRVMHIVRNSSKGFNLHADYLLVYARNVAWFEESPERYIRQPQDKSGSYPHDDGDGRGAYKLDPLHARNYYTPYEHTFENGVVWRPPAGSYPRYAPETVAGMEREDKIVFQRGEPKAKRYLREVQEGVPPNTVLDPKDVGFNAEGTRELRGVFGADKVFPQPKPTRLVRYLLDLANDKDAIVLDFFAGSGTTGHAVMAKNAEDGGARRFFLVQLPEPIAEDSKEQQMAVEFLQSLPELGGAARKLTIAELTKERLRRASQQLRDGSDTAGKKSDLGFRVLKLDSTNIRAWEPDRANVADSLIDQVEHVKPGRSEDDLHFELLLKLGYDLCARSEERTIAGKRVTALADGSLITCFAESIDAGEVDELVLGIKAWRDELQPEQDISIVYRDSAFKDDVDKANVTEQLAQHGIKDVRSV